MTIKKTKNATMQQIKPTQSLEENTDNAEEKLQVLSSFAFQIRSLHDPHFIPRPHEDEFFVAPENWSQTLLAIIHDMPLLIVGPSGSGKTELIYRAAKAVRKKLEPFNMGAMTEPRSSLIGVTHFDPSRGTVFQESRFVQMLRKPNTIILLDEINRAPKEAQNMLIPLLDDQKYIALDEAEDCGIVHPAEGVGFAATANIGCEYTGTTELDWAIMNRFQVVIRMDFMDADREMEVLLRRCPGLNRFSAVILAKIARKQRELWCDGEFSVPISTRSLIAAAKQCVRGVHPETAFHYCIRNQFSTSGGLVSDCEKIGELWKFSGFIQGKNGEKI